MFKKIIDSRVARIEKKQVEALVAMSCHGSLLAPNGTIIKKLD